MSEIVQSKKTLSHHKGQKNEKETDAHVIAQMGEAPSIVFRHDVNNHIKDRNNKYQNRNSDK